MLGSSVIHDYDIPGLPNMAVGSPYEFAFASPFVSAHFADVSLRNWPEFRPSEHDAPYVEAVRLLCNFADGFLWIPLDPGDSAMQFWMWYGQFVVPPNAPSAALIYTPRTFNEWTEVNAKLPRNTPDTSGIWGGPSFLGMGKVRFSTDGINPVFNGSPVTMRLQLKYRSGIQ